MRLVTARLICALGAAAGCATASSDDSSDGSGADAAVTPPSDGGGGSDGSAVVASACPPDEFATGLDESGALECAPIDDAATAAVNEHCSMYLGWRDSCDGCTTPPAKWGQVSGTSCASGAGLDNGCVTASLGGVDVDLFGLSTDGDVNDDDKFYLGWHCIAPQDSPAAGPCPAGSYLSAVDGEGGECVTARDVIVGYAHNSCDLYAGFRDSCDGCATAPAKWGQVSGEVCANGTGAGNTCTLPALGDQTVQTFGLNSDGDVNDDDKLYLGFQCNGAAPADGLVDRACPAGQLVVAIEGDGQIRCASPLPAAEAAIRTGCQLYFGWRDSCDGCQLAPAKWGRVSHAACENGAGANDTCAPAQLNGNSVQLFGLNTDGDVDGNDKFYLGLECN